LQNIRRRVGANGFHSPGSCLTLHRSISL
jgi:hypothetical protein